MSVVVNINGIHDAKRSPGDIETLQDLEDTLHSIAAVYEHAQMTVAIAENIGFAIRSFLIRLAQYYTVQPDWDVGVTLQPDNKTCVVSVRLKQLHLSDVVTGRRRSDGQVMASLDLPDGEHVVATGANEVQAVLALNEQLRKRAL